MPKERAKPARQKGFEPDVKKTKVLYDSITTKPRVIVGANPVKRPKTVNPATVLRGN